MHSGGRSEIPLGITFVQETQPGSNGFSAVYDFRQYDPYLAFYKKGFKNPDSGSVRNEFLFPTVDTGISLHVEATNTPDPAVVVNGLYQRPGKSKDLVNYFRVKYDDFGDICEVSFLKPREKGSRPLLFISFSFNTVTAIPHNTSTPQEAQVVIQPIQFNYQNGTIYYKTSKNSQILIFNDMNDKPVIYVSIPNSIGMPGMLLSDTLSENSNFPTEEFIFTINDH